MTIEGQRKKHSLISNYDVINLWLQTPTKLFKFSDWGVPLVLHLFKNGNSLSLSIIFDKIIDDLGVEIAKDITSLSFVMNDNDEYSLEVVYQGNFIYSKGVKDDY